jgi:phage terminase large subunit GpA-like protein
MPSDLLQPGVHCPHCGQWFALTLAAVETQKLRELPDPFLAKCSRCQRQANYPKAFIRTLGEERRQ